MPKLRGRCIRKEKWKKYLSIVVALLAVNWPFNTKIAWAAERTPTDRETQNQQLRQQIMERDLREQRKSIFLQPETQKQDNANLPEEEISFPVRKITLSGVRSEEFSWLAKLYHPYEDRKIGMQGIQRIVKLLNQALLEHGYVTTRIVIPEQDISQGVLRLEIVVGVIHDIRFHDAAQPVTWQNAFPCRPGDILNLRDIEQGLEQLKRVPSQDVDMQIVPGEALGESDIVISTKQTKPWRFIFTLDDSGSKATGKLQVSQTLAIDNLMHANDLFHVTANNDGERAGNRYGTKGNSFYYSIPNGNWTYSINRNTYDYHQIIWTGTQNLSYSGSSKDVKYTIDTLWRRDQNSKTNLEMSLLLRKSRSYVEDTEIAVQRKDTTALCLAINHRQAWNNNNLDIRIAHKQGMPWFGAQDDNEGTPTTRYHIWNMDATLTKPFNLGSANGEYRMRFSGQFTRDTLYAVDCFSIGNRYTVRGFDGEQTLSGECGLYWQNEWSFPIGQEQQIYTGIDYGCIGGSSSNLLPGKELIGAVLGLRGVLAKNLQYDIFTGWPIKKPDELVTANPTYGFQVVWQL